MYDSYYKADDIVNEIDKEMRISVPVTKHQYCGWLNMVEQMLYTDIVREQRKVIVPHSRKIDLFGIDNADEWCDIVRAEDVLNVYCVGEHKVELEHASIDTEYAVQPEYTYHIEGQTLYVNAPEGTDIHIIYLARPIPKRVIGDKITGTVAVPIEFLEMIRCRLRGEKYRLQNEDEYCAKWINEYNFHLENFKQYVETRRERV